MIIYIHNFASRMLIRSFFYFSDCASLSDESKRLSLLASRKKLCSSQASREDILYFLQDVQRSKMADHKRYNSYQGLDSLCEEQIQVCVWGGGVGYRGFYVHKRYPQDRVISYCRGTYNIQFTLINSNQYFILF